MLNIRGLTKSYGPIMAVRDVDLDVEPGRMVGFVGPNGAGKSTTMRSVMRLVEPDAGTIEWSGRMVDASTLERVGYLPEQRGLYPKMAIAEQVAYFAELKGFSRRKARTRAEDLLGELGLADRLDDKLHKLSHGNQQRVQLAVALACDPELLILDEPFNGLDPVAAKTLQAVLEERVAAGAAVLFSSHQLELVERVCDELAVIIDGRIEAAGAIDEVKSQRGTRSAFVRIDRPDPAHGGGVEGSGANGSGSSDRGAISLTEALVGFDLIDVSSTSASVVLDSERDLDALLARARMAGPVLDLRYELPPLTELFAHLVAEAAEDPDAATVASDLEGIAQ